MHCVFCTLFLLLLYQSHLRSSGIRSHGVGAPTTGRQAMGGLAPGLHKDSNGGTGYESGVLNSRCSSLLHPTSVWDGQGKVPPHESVVKYKVAGLNLD